MFYRIHQLHRYHCRLEWELLLQGIVSYFICSLLLLSRFETLMWHLHRHYVIGFERRIWEVVIFRYQGPQVEEYGWFIGNWFIGWCFSQIHLQYPTKGLLLQVHVQKWWGRKILWVSRKYFCLSSSAKLFKYHLRLLQRLFSVWNYSLAYKVWRSLGFFYLFLRSFLFLLFLIVWEFSLLWPFQRDFRVISKPFVLALFLQDQVIELLFFDKIWFSFYL